MKTRLLIGTLCFTLFICLVVWGAAVFSFGVSHQTALALGVLPCLLLAVCLWFWASLTLVTPALEVHRHIESFGQGLAFTPISNPDEFAFMHEKLSSMDADYHNEHALARSMREIMPMAYLMVDTKERAISTNQACLDMLEISDSIKNCLGKTLAELFYNDHFRSTAVGQSMQTGKIFSNLEVTITGHKGRETHVLANVFPIRDDKGKSIAGLCLYSDITKLKQAQFELEKQNQEIHKEMKQQKKSLLKPLKK